MKTTQRYLSAFPFVLSDLMTCRIGTVEEE